MDTRKLIIHIHDLAIVEHLTNEQSGQLLFALVHYCKHGALPDKCEFWLTIACSPFIQKINAHEKASRAGIHHWNWQDGKTPENRIIRQSADIKNWRRAVFERDDYTCQSCSIRGGILHAHHLKPFSLFPELRCELSNGLTLCKPCHNKIHSKK